MTKIIPEIYKDYPIQPYISKSRDLKDWEDFPEKYPYSKVEKKQMIKLDENLLPGDIVLLWRVKLGTFTTNSIFPEYFEYKYGINGKDSLNLLVNLNLIRKCSAVESLDIVNSNICKRILEKYDLKKSGNKKDLVQRISKNISENDLSREFNLRKYEITSNGYKILEKYYYIIEKHGMKK